MRNRLALIWLLLLIASLLAYSGTLGHGFVDFDDPEYVRDNAWVKQGLNEQTLAWAFTTKSLTNYHPMTWVSLLLDTTVYSTFAPFSGGLLMADPNGLYPSGYHFTNVLLHCVNVLLLFSLLHRMTGALWRSAFVAALFALHPVHVESVAWISERKDVLSMLFLLLTIWSYCNYARDRDVRAYVLTAVFLALGLLSKPMLVTLPFVLLLLDYWPLRRLNVFSSAHDAQSSKTNLSWLILEKLPLMALSLASAVITFRLQQYGELSEGRWAPMSERVANVIVSYVRYLGKLFWPVDLAPLYPNPSLIGKPFWSMNHVLAALAILIVITAAALALARNRRYFILGWLWFLGTLVPVIGFLQIGRHSMADRYAYIPFIGLYIAIAWGVTDLTARWKSRNIPLAIAAIALCGVLGAMTFAQSQHWRDSITLFDHTLRVTDENWLIHNNYAAVLDRQDRREEALQQLHRALEIYPGCAWMYDHLGTMYSRHQRWFDAQTAFHKAIELDPNFDAAHYNLGVIYINRNTPSQALPHFKRAVELKPNNPEWHKALGMLFGTLGEYDGAIAELEEARRLNSPNKAEIEEILSHYKTERDRKGV
jgi:protein O-mannosyl-transferase